jgi:peptidoglycan/xylan/chitin deacetylase (PgdA/CDA1 family)
MLRLRSTHALAIVLCVTWQWAMPTAWAKDTRAVILVYHHVDKTTPRSTSVTPGMFATHLEFLQQFGYRVVPLERVVRALKRAKRLPPRTVALTFDDAYLSVHSEALLRLERLDWPFTVFVSTDAIDQGQRHTMTWDQLRDIEDKGGRIANHSRSHAHLVRRLPEENDEAWAQRVRSEILDAQDRLDAELNRPLHVFAYPYGEHDADLGAIVSELGYAAVGQQSGPVGPATDPQNIPRFPIATGFDDLRGLEEKLNTVALPVTIIKPESHVLAPESTQPELDLRIENGSFDLNQLTCFVSGQSSAKLTWLDRPAGILRVQARQPLVPGRAKYTCTAPSKERSGVYYWYSHVWMKRGPNGSWYDG